MSITTCVNGILSVCARVERRIAKPGLTEDTFLLVQGKMIVVLGDERLREQTCGGDAFVDDMGCGTGAWMSVSQ